MSNSFKEDWPKSGVLLGVILGLGLIGVLIIVLFVQATPAPTSELYGDIPNDPKLLEIDKVALDEAYHDQLKFLFSVWLKDGGRNVQGITTGLRNARSAHALAAAQIAKREQQIGR